MQLDFFSSLFERAPWIVKSHMTLSKLNQSQHIKEQPIQNKNVMFRQNKNQPKNESHLIFEQNRC